MPNIDIRVQDPDDAEQNIAVLRSAWGGASDSSLIPEHFFKAAARTGNLLGAYDGDDVIGFLLMMPEFGTETVYVHAAGVRDERKRQGIGTRLFKEMRRRAEEAGYQRATWTFEPLDSANGSFYIDKLGADATTYKSAAYSSMSNEETGGKTPADRLTATWRFNDEQKLEDAEAVTVLSAGREMTVDDDASYVVRQDGGWAIGDVPAADRYLIEIPGRFPALKEAGLEETWRYASRAAFTYLMDRGFTVRGFDRADNYYVLAR